MLAEFWAEDLIRRRPRYWFTILVKSWTTRSSSGGGAARACCSMLNTRSAYLALAGAMHDSAVATWSVKGYYDYPPGERHPPYGRDGPKF